MLEKKSIRILITLILLFLLIYLISITSFVFQPLGAYLTAIAVPIIGAGAIFYVTNPLVNWLEKKKVPRIGGTGIVFLIIVLVIMISVTIIAPIVQRQFSNLIDNIPAMVETTQKFINMWQDNQNIIPSQLDDTVQRITGNLDSYAETLTTFIIDLIGQIFSFVFAFFLIPFFLFFMLKDGHKFVPFVSQFLSKHKAKSFKELTADINHTLSSFIQGQFIVSLCVGVMLYIGYIIIDLDYSLTLALFAILMNFIPFIGPFLSAIPAVIVGFFQDPIMVVWVILVMVIAQQIEGNFISPNIMGRALSIHPLTVITLILAAGGIAGFLGLLFIIPAYAVVKAVVAHFYHEWQKKQPGNDPNIF